MGAHTAPSRTQPIALVGSAAPSCSSVFSWLISVPLHRNKCKPGVNSAPKGRHLCHRPVFFAPPTRKRSLVRSLFCSSATFASLASLASLARPPVALVFCAWLAFISFILPFRHSHPFVRSSACFAASLASLARWRARSSFRFRWLGFRSLLRFACSSRLVTRSVLRSARLFVRSFYSRVFFRRSGRGFRPVMCPCPGLRRGELAAGCRPRFRA